MRIVKKQAKIERDEHGDLWAKCPNCGKKATIIFPETMAHNFPWKCRNTKCTHKEFLINYQDDLCLI